MPLVPTPKNCDPSVKKAIQILTQKLGLKSVPIHANITLTDLTASRLVATDTDKEFESVPGTSAHPEFSGISIKDSSDNLIFYVDDDEMYFTGGAVAIADGMCIGLLLALTYKT
jgi:hypothetical protein